ncbi:MAG: hypothetical protein HYU66_25310 [Armatimonadetes bacterium]|nr:hypothetical protein [Armatimonadota bacterium]
MKRGYKLLELMLYVFAVTALAVAVLFPVLAPVHHGCRQASCISNEKQIMLALLQYATDWDQHLPPLVSAGSAGPHTWVADLDVYAKNRSLFVCPSTGGDHARARRLRANQELVESPAGGWSSYGANALHAASGPPTEVFNARTLLPVGHSAVHPSNADLRQASETIAIAETDGLPVVFSTAPGHFPSGHVAAPSLNLPRHTRGANYAFADGHVKWMKPEKAQCDSGGGKDGCPWSVE